MNFKNTFFVLIACIGISSLAYSNFQVISTGARVESRSAINAIVDFHEASGSDEMEHIGVNSQVSEQRFTVQGSAAAGCTAASTVKTSMESGGVTESKWAFPESGGGTINTGGWNRASLVRTFQVTRLVFIEFNAQAAFSFGGFMPAWPIDPMVNHMRSSVALAINSTPESPFGEVRADSIPGVMENSTKEVHMLMPGITYRLTITSDSRLFRDLSKIIYDGEAGEEVIGAYANASLRIIQ